LLGQRTGRVESRHVGVQKERVNERRNSKKTQPEIIVFAGLLLLDHWEDFVEELIVPEEI
jgi:hypothetical protein